MKVLILTGGSSGIGKATAELFAQNGYKVYELSRHGVDNGGIKHIGCDVTNTEDCKNAVLQVMDEEGRVDLLISNAGMGISGPVEFSAPEDIRRQMDVNFFGSVNITQAVLPVMRKQHAGRIIFISSAAAIFAIPFQSFYSASKFAINGFAMALRNEVRPLGISVSCLLPGDVKTGFTDARKKNETGAEVYPRLHKAISTMEHDEQHGILPERMAHKLLYIANQSSPCCYYTVGLIYHLYNFLNKIVPARIVYWVIGKMY